MATFLALAIGGTMIFMPLAAPLLTMGFSVDPWTIAKPLLFFVAAPLVIGVAARRASEAFAEKLHPTVRR